MTAADDLIGILEPQIGRPGTAGAWLEIDQERIDRFAQVTGDRQWIHIDPERAARESAYGNTVAHGFLTLSLLPFLTRSNDPDAFRTSYPGMRLRVNYGLNRVRFPAPVRCGDRIRAHSQLQSVVRAGEGVEVVYLMTVEIDGGDKPACVAEQIFRLYP